MVVTGRKDRNLVESKMSWLDQTVGIGQACLWKTTHWIGRMMAGMALDRVDLAVADVAETLIDLGRQCEAEGRRRIVVMAK